MNRYQLGMATKKKDVKHQPKPPSTTSDILEEKLSALIDVKEKVLVDVREFYNWVQLRNDCLWKIQELSSAIISIPVDRRNCSGRSQLLVLVRVIQSISCRVVNVYYKFLLTWRCSSVDMIRLCDQMTFYVNQMIDSLNFLSFSPFAEWLGVDSYRNPLLVHTHSLFESAGGLSLDQVVAANEKLHQICSTSPMFNSRIMRRRESTCACTNDAGDDESAPEDIQGGLEDSIKRTKILRLRGWMLAWRQSCVLERIRLDILGTRTTNNLRLVFDRFRHNVWCSSKYRAMQQRVMRRRVLKIVQAWKDYTIWCLRLAEFRKRALLLFCKQYVKAWRRLAREEFSVRNYWKHFKHHRLIALFNALRSNAKLNRYFLMKRLKNLTTLSFKERSQLQYSFRVWRSRLNIVIAFDKLEIHIELSDLKLAFKKWVFVCSGLTMPVSASLVQFGTALAGAAVRSSEAVMSEIVASRRDGYSTMHTVANAFLGREVASSCAESVRHFDDKVIHLTAQTAAVGVAALKTSTDKATALTAAFNKFIERKFPDGLRAAMARRLSLEDGEAENPILTQLQRRRRQLAHETARKSRMARALMYAREHGARYELRGIEGEEASTGVGNR